MSFANGPDLTVTDLHVLSGYIEDGSTPVDMVFDVVNEGNYPTGPFGVSIWLQTYDDGAREDHLIMSYTHSDLAAGENSHEELSFLPPQAALHQNLIIVRVDGAGTVAEPDETNNEAQHYFNTLIPRIISITDTPSDGGGYVDLTFFRSLEDDPANGCPIAYYEVFRKNIDAPASAVADYMASRDRLNGAPVSDPFPQSIVARVGPDFAPATYTLDDWTLAATVTADFSDEYTVSVPTEGTLFHEVVWSTYFVRAASDCLPGTFYYSCPDSGFSYDNRVGPAENLDCFHASVEDGSIKVVWRLLASLGTEQFSVWRSAEESAYETLEVDVITTGAASFCFFDETVEPGKDYSYRVEQKGASGPYVLFETEEVRTPAVALTLYQNRPNPFNPSTGISYYLPKASSVRLEIFDVSGRRVRTLVDGAQPPGRYAVEWAGRDDSGGRVSSGVYFYRLRAGKRTLTRKMVLMR